MHRRIARVKLEMSMSGSGEEVGTSLSDSRLA